MKLLQARYSRVRYFVKTALSTVYSEFRWKKLRSHTEDRRWSFSNVQFECPSSQQLELNVLVSASVNRFILLFIIHSSYLLPWNHHLFFAISFIFRWIWNLATVFSNRMGLWYSRNLPQTISTRTTVQLPTNSELRAALKLPSLPLVWHWFIELRQVLRGKLLRYLG